MTQLVNQPTAAPTRKMYAVAAAAAFVAALRSLVAAQFPDLEFGPVLTLAQPFIEGAFIAAAGYMTKERAGA